MQARAHYYAGGCESVHSLKALLDDLLDFNRTKLGIGIAISPAAVDLGEAFSAELELLRVAHPGRSIDLEVTGNVSGVWDINRLNQLLGNLVVNAIKHGSSSSPVRVVLNEFPEEVRFMVHNRGPKIERSMLAQIFEPLKRGSDNQFLSSADRSLGLGLYITREITNAHQGAVHDATRIRTSEAAIIARNGSFADRLRHSRAIATGQLLDMPGGNRDSLDDGLAIEGSGSIALIPLDAT